MKVFKLLTLATFALLFSQCSSTSPTEPVTKASVREVAMTIDTTEFMLINYADSTNGDAEAALTRTADWLKKQTNIKNVSVVANNYLYFTLTSGLTGLYYLNSVDASGTSIVRGGGGGGSLNKWETLSNNKIKNKSVLVFAPVFDEFYKGNEFDVVLNTFSNSELGFSVTVKKDKECTNDVVDHFADYGLVIMDTHGMPNGFLIGSQIKLPTSEEGEKEEIEINLGKNGYEDFQEGHIILARSLVFNKAQSDWWKSIAVKPPRDRDYAIFLTSAYIDELPMLSNTVVFGNMCFSGQGILTTPPFQGVQKPIRTAFMEREPICYYGYAYANNDAAVVTNDFAKQMEEAMLKQLITNTDSTGHSHLASNGTEYRDTLGLTLKTSNGNLLFKQFGAKDYSYKADCADSLVDPRDGQKYAAVCIGKQVWMAENLRYNAPGSTEHSYGQLYDPLLGTASICPNGWHVPSGAEWQQLFDLFGGIGKAGGALKSTSSDWGQPNVGATNISGFNARPGGYIAGNFGGYQYLYEEAIFISTDVSSGGGPMLVILDYNYAQAYFQGRNKDSQANCRCLKD